MRGRLIAKYTTANSGTFAMPNGHMLTQVYEHPINHRDSAGNWQPLTGTQAAGPKARPGASPAPSATANAERNPLGQENESACTLTSTASTTSACNELTFKAGYETAGKSALHGLIQFTLPDLHEELIVLNAQLELYAAKTTTSTGVAMGAYRVTTPWTTGATWNTTNGSTPWNTPGGDYANPEKESDAAINPSVGTKTGWTYWYPTRMVQEWYNGTIAPNGQGQSDLGFLLKDATEGTANNVVTFDGREERERNPGLTLEWVQRGVGNATNYTQLPIKLSSTQGLSVNPASGNLSIHSTDLQVPSKGFAFESARTWNSLQNEAPGYGYGWVDSNAVRVQVMPSGNVGYTDSSGNTFPFIKEGTNFKTPTGIEATMCEAGSPAPCPTTLPSGTVYQLIYTNTLQRINFGWKEKVGNFLEYYVVSVQDASGDIQTAKYSGTLEDPISWKDTENTEIAYTESESKGYTKITDVGNGRSMSYTETLGEDGLYHLTQYTNANNEKTTYTYGPELENNLVTQITEPNGTVIKLFYYSNYQIAKIIRTTNAEHTKGPTTSYTYYELGKAPAPCTSTQKATVITETEGNEEPTLTYCSNVLDEVEQVAGYPAMGQSGGYLAESEPINEAANASVDLASGNLSIGGPDLSIESESENEVAPMLLERVYNSQTAKSGKSLGSRWSWSTGPTVYLSDYGGTVVVHGPSGYAIALRRISASSYASPGEFEGTLTKNADGTFTLTNAADPTYRFNAAGVLASETPEAGETETVSNTEISGMTVLHKLTAASGKYFEVGYGGSGRVESVKGSAGESHYGYNASNQLTSYTSPSGEKTEYGYSEAGYINKIVSSEGTQSIVTTTGKVTEVTFTPVEGSVNVVKYAYQAAQAPTCNPATDAGETTVTTAVTGEPEQYVEAFCYNAAGEYTGPKESEAEEEEGTETPPELSGETCTEDPELHKEDCALEEGAPEETEDLPKKDYGIADNNWLQGRGFKTPFNYLSEATITSLHAKKYRRTVPWNMVSEAEHNEETPGDNPGAAANLADVEEWIKRVKEAGGEPYIGFDIECPSATQWDDPRKLSSAEEEKDDHECKEPPNKAQYKAAVERFLKPTAKHTILGEVHNFESLNEPNNEGLSKTGEHVKPTWSATLSPPGAKHSGAWVAGEYWRALDDLCASKGCFVAAGDFLDTYMINAWNKRVNQGYTYFHQYYEGMGKAPKANRWAWHAYSEGENTYRYKSYRNHPKRWWKPFKLFQKAVDRVMEHAKYKYPNIWLTEQGVEYFLNEAPREAWKHRGAGPYILHAFVEHGSQQLTRQLNPVTKKTQITRFFYYSTRGAPGFDSGLLEAALLPKGFKSKYPNHPNHPRTIYRVYAKKTPRR